MWQINKYCRVINREMGKKCKIKQMECPYFKTLVRMHENQ